jgi:hypothetical protein
MTTSSEAAREVVKRNSGRTAHVVIAPHALDHEVECGSKVEAAFVRRAILHPAVMSVRHQPFRMELTHGKYTPNFLVTLKDKSLLVAEVSERPAIPS